ncbi:HD domain-containing protein [Bacillus sp. 31A1R]|uniref:HD domain-containing protein n=1 Tax=Robertmurraya mangrovi TaxID=3098077 RepID=A0ABU5J347_9BACI|nr:HD domain-containing phosphohydrolase [Bacillus sp. 31A1R]MDZ5473829.1 HD domain-containing protein [Bacillus sp. 31A1R]
MKIYQQFIRRLVINYLFGSLLAVFGIGGTLIFVTIDLIHNEQNIVLLLMFSSVLCMFFCEGLIFLKHLKPIKAVFKVETPSRIVVEQSIQALLKFPLSTVKRIMIPHYLGLTVPASIGAYVLVHFELLHLPKMYIVYAIVAAFFIAVLHALIEFYLTLQAIKPLLIHIKSSYLQKNEAIFNENELILPINRKFQVTVLLMGILPILVFLLAAQIKLSDLTGMDMNLYWNWAGSILIFTVVYAFLVSKFLTRDIEQPIRELQHFMNNVYNENYDFVKVNVYTDEFSQVFTGFNHMTKTIHSREETNKQLLESFMATLSITLDARDPYTSGHSMRVASYSYEIGRELNLSKEDLELLYQTALLHDIGKIGVPDSVLLKDGKLTDDEFSYIKAHPVIGENILKQVQPASKIAGLLPGVRHHHERIDGRGYPDGLTGTDIPYFGRIIAVADGFDAMTSDRPYRKGMSIEKAIEILKSGKGTQWDETIVDVFITIINSKQIKGPFEKAVG